MSSPPLPPNAANAPAEVDRPTQTVPTPTHADSTQASATTRAPSPAPAALKDAEWPLWEVFVRSKSGLDHKHCGSLHASDPKLAIQLARDVYTRRQEGSSIWVVRSDQITASDPAEKGMYFDPAEDKVYRHPTFYKLPKSVDHM